MRKSASWDNFFEKFSHDYKTGLEVIDELEKDGFSAGHMKSKMHEYLNEWQAEGLLESRYRRLTDKERIIRNKADGVKPQLEYRLPSAE